MRSDKPKQIDALVKALKEIEQLGEKSLGESNACRMGNIAHAALVAMKSDPVTSHHTTKEE